MGIGSRQPCLLVQIDGSEHWWFEDRGPQSTPRPIDAGIFAHQVRVTPDPTTADAG